VKGLLLIALLCATLAFAGCGGSDSSSSTTGTTASVSTTAPPTANRTKPKVEVPKGAPPKQLVKKDLIVGEGRVAKTGDFVSVQYVGVDYKTGKQFDASWDRGQPFPFQLGAGQVIPGWDKGIVGMRVGGRRELIIPPDLAYGAQGQPPTIKPNSTLVFVVDLLSVN
jgi:peptidylprolyl isomerase